MSSSLVKPGRPRIIFFGNERLATGITTTCPTLHRLAHAGYDIVAVVANYEAGKSRKNRPLEIQTAADSLGIPVLLPGKPSEITEQLRDYSAVAGVLVAYGRIVPQSIIDIFPRGIINIHPSLLPLHRGPTPIESVILEGATQTGVSIMQLVRSMDAGPVYAQQRISLAQPSKQHLVDQLLNIGGDLLVQHLPAIIDGSLLPQPQDESLATYDKLIEKVDGIIDTTKSAEQLEREIRAYAGWPGSRTILAGKEVIITSATATTESGRPGTTTTTNGKLVLHCTSGSLEILLLKPASKTEMTAQAFLAGNKL